MWAAANSGSGRTSNLQDSDWDSESSGERSTTESIQGDNLNVAPTNRHNYPPGERRRKKRRKKKQKCEETPEATIARLTMSYSAAMGAVGALHRVSRQILTNGVNKVINEDTKDNGGLREVTTVIGELRQSNKQQIDSEKVEMQIDWKEAKGFENGIEKTGEPQNKLDEAHSIIQKVARSARSSMEQSLLLDPIVMATILLPSSMSKKSFAAGNQLEDVPLEKMTSAWWTVWTSSHESPNRKSFHKGASLSRWKKLSVAHKSTVKQIAYLSLVNYADLLMCGCSCCDLCSGDILDRRPVKSLDVLKLFLGDGEIQQEQYDHCRSCLWYESREQTLRLALASYCDASDLDSTDPTLWFKVACTARSLGRVVDLNKSTSAAWRPQSYRLLERLASERGLNSLPKGVPPNRMLMRAMRELEKWDQSQGSNHLYEEFDSVIADENRSHDEPVKLVIHLPKYSWSVLGKILIQACKEGVGYGRSDPVAHVWSTNSKTPKDSEFGSPFVVIQISPILMLSNTALEVICEYLGQDSSDIGNLALTCRALSSEIQSAISKIRSHRRPCKDVHIEKVGEKPIEKTDASNVSAIEQQKAISDVACKSQGESNALNIDIRSNNVDATSMASSELKQLSSNSPRPAISRERVSKRVRSQMMTSEKETERKAKRESVEYCFLAGTLSCTSENPEYKRLLKTDVDWNSNPVLKSCVDEIGRQHPHISLANTNTLNSTTLESPSSLGLFVETVNKNNSGPMHSLEHFILYVAMNPADVFGGSKSDFTTCFLDCFDLFTMDKNGYMETSIIWYGSEDFDSNNLDCTLQILAVNLLVAELRLKEVTKQDYLKDSGALAFTLPIILKFAVSIARFCDGNKLSRIAIELSCRSYWLAAEYYFWFSRSSNDALHSADGERLGIEYLDKALNCLNTIDSLGKRLHIKIYTPQLQSSHREGQHWSMLSYETLSVYRKTLQSSSVVSRTRSEFLIIIQSTDNTDDVPTDQVKKLNAIGAELLDWYCKGNETSKGKFEEIVSDFIVQHQDLLMLERSTPMSTIIGSGLVDEFYWGGLWSCIPSSKAAGTACIASTVSSRPSIIYVLMCCLLESDENLASILNVLAQLTLTALKMYSTLLADKSEIETGKVSSESSKDWQKDRQDEQMMNTANYFMDKMIALLHLREVNFDEFDSWDILHSIICESMNTLSTGGLEEISVSRFHFIRSISQYVSSLRTIKAKQETIVGAMEHIYFATMTKVFVVSRKDYRHIMSTDTDKRVKSYQNRLTSATDFVCHIANELAECLSLNQSTITDQGALILSPLINTMVETKEYEYDDLSTFIKLSDSVVWFWKHVNDHPDKSDVVRMRLLKPISALFVSLCGSFGSSIQNRRKNEDRLGEECSKNDHIFDYFDSDDSCNEVYVEDNHVGRKTILKSLNQLVQCISLIYSANEKSVCYEHTSFNSPMHEHGPLLSLITIRILSNISDSLFKIQSHDLWDENYPYGARSCGAALDHILASAYRSVYGISLVGQTQATPDVTKDQVYLPESIEAAARLFRCIRRLYSRRSLPVRALELIDKALPPSQVTPVSSAIREFLFCGDKHISPSQCKEDLPANFPEWIFNESETKAPKTTESKSDRLRKLVSAELAKGSITHLDSNQFVSEDDGYLSEERELTRNHELALYNKFRVLLDDLSNNPSNIEGWVVLSETCGFKADILCDRLVSIKDPFIRADFRPLSSSFKSPPGKLSLNDLKQNQLDEFEATRTNWVPFLGNDLLIYMQYPWSSFASLQACAKDIKSKINAKDTSECRLLEELESKYEEGNYVSWANDWAGMFVLALRRMKIRALTVARYLAKTMRDNAVMHPSDVCEDLGTALYGDLIGSTSYGYPMRVMTAHEKREIAQYAKFFFDEAVDLSSNATFSCKCEIVLWENHFMIGKCYEKIASTLRDELFVTCEQTVHRYYERSLKSALQTYSVAMVEADQREQSGSGLGKNEKGGSSHGKLEVFYRIHACKFKALLFSIRRAKEEQQLAEAEVLRIVSIAWFGDSTGFQTSQSHQYKMWIAFVNCVEAFIQCRKDEPKFHRSAFRLAQAFNWAPVFQKPDHPVPIDTSRIPSIDSISLPCIEAGSCEKNAALAIDGLFDKRRSQLVAVWVTTSTTPPPFEVLNDSIRKYDNLRLKYILAYIDCMKQSKQMDKLENLLNYTSSCPQDLAGFYQASAAVRGGDPGRHTKQSLLTTSGFLAQVKRSVNDALAELILDNLVDLKQNGVDAQKRAVLEAGLKLSNTLFSRLNVTPEEAVLSMLANGPVLQAVVLCKCFMSIQSGYRVNDSIRVEKLDSDTLISFVEQALSKAKAMFPAKAKPQQVKRL